MKAHLLHKDGEYHFTATAALDSGDVVATPDGRAAVYAALRSAAIGDAVCAYTEGVFWLAKKASTAFAKGVAAWWDFTNKQVDASGDIYLGTVQRAAASADAELLVDLNAAPAPNLVTRSAAFSGAGSAYLFPNGSPCKMRLVNWWIICQNGTAGNVKLDDGAASPADITANVAKGTTDTAIVAGTIDDATWDIAAGTKVRVTASGGAGTVVAQFMPI